MKRNTIAMLVAGVLALGLSLGSLTTASAKIPARPALPTMTRLMAGISPVKALASMTGLPADEIAALHVQGMSYSAVAIQNGAAPTAVARQTAAARRSYLNAFVAARRMTAARRNALIAAMSARVLAIMNVVPQGTTVGLGVPSSTPPSSVPATYGLPGGFMNGDPMPGYVTSGTPMPTVDPGVVTDPTPLYPMMVPSIDTTMPGVLYPVMPSRTSPPTMGMGMGGSYTR